MESLLHFTRSFTTSTTHHFWSVARSRRAPRSEPLLRHFLVRATCPRRTPPRSWLRELLWHRCQTSWAPPLREAKAAPLSRRTYLSAACRVDLLLATRGFLSSCSFAPHSYRAYAQGACREGLQAKPLPSPAGLTARRVDLLPQQPGVRKVVCVLLLRM